MCQAQLEKKVEDYLRNSQELEDGWQRPISAEQLQAEMDRMAKHTRQPEVLRELFEALGNDPFVVAECLARPVLVERLVRTSSEGTGADRLTKTESGKRSAEVVASASLNYALPAISDGSNGCMGDIWSH